MNNRSQAFFDASGAPGLLDRQSQSSASLLPRVEAGVFTDTLYYRLNTVCVDVTA